MSVLQIATLHARRDRSPPLSTGGDQLNVFVTLIVVLE